VLGRGRAALHSRHPRWHAKHAESSPRRTFLHRRIGKSSAPLHHAGRRELEVRQSLFLTIPIISGYGTEQGRGIRKVGMELKRQYGLGGLHGNWKTPQARADQEQVKACYS